MKKSSRFARIAHQVAKSTWWSITAKSFGLKRRRGKPTRGTLCLKGYYGWDFINDTQILTPRLKTPMIRRQRGGKLEAVSSTRRWITSPPASAPLKPNMARMRSKPPAPPAAPVMKPTM